MCCLEIGKEAYRFERRRFEVLCLVHDQHKASAREHLAKQDLVQLLVHRREIHSRGLDAKLAEEVAEKLTGVTLRLEQKHRPRRIAQLFHKPIQNGGFSHSRVGDERHESTAGFDAIQESGEGLAVRTTRIKVRGVWSNAKRLFAETVEIQEHRGGPPFLRLDAAHGRRTVLRCTGLELRHHSPTRRDQAAAPLARTGTFLPNPTFNSLISSMPSLTVAFTRSGSI